MLSQKPRRPQFVRIRGPWPCGRPTTPTRPESDPSISIQCADINGGEYRNTNTGAYGKDNSRLLVQLRLGGQPGTTIDEKGHRESFQYDNQQQLVEVDGLDSQSFSYDAAGRFVTKTAKYSFEYGHGAPFHAPKYVRYESGWRDEFDYDKNGNRKSGPNGSFEYTADNRVERIFVDDLHWGHFDSAGNLLLSSSTSVGLSGSVNGAYNGLGAAYFSAYSYGFVPSDYSSNTVGYKWQQLQTSNGSWSPF
jgi:YD repeat-containing protein